MYFTLVLISDSHKPTLALSPFLPLLTSDQKWFRKETLQTAHEDKKEPCMSRLAFISWDIWTEIWFICSIFSTLFLTLIDFVHPTSTITVWSACEKTIKTKKDINAICGFIMSLKKKHRKIQKSKNNGSGFIVRKTRSKFAPETVSTEMTLGGGIFQRGLVSKRKAW